ncbi:uncharacterized protein BCR38DRAFT_410856 [Pseudomassariella vexata]|uniref:Ubiquitin-like domain-containing protein n=1 Tax=Pseudomassariella vexata TaxID=1141098 RepID=A0A1Y2DTH2_9PEZI|nr:uncharacterized protein BCR38DRAFT_410856 [Pseudomassariella vexata]ORY62444.1 hypothetical protein BCR38DRAFT_410856 [Pseudomassariella vexata]
MGCCFSRPVGPNAPYPSGAPSGSARAINSPQLQASAPEESGQISQSHSPSHPNSNTHRSRRHSHQQQPLSQHIDKPLRRHRWAAENRTWTPTQLAQERADFFDTRVTGRPEVWQTLKVALEVLWEPNAYDEGATAMATAQGILKAADITLPTGDLANGAYDSLGNHYALPEWIVSDPINIANDRDAETAGVDADRKGEDGLGPDVEVGDTTDALEVDETLRRREEKGKAVENVQDLVNVRARLSENARDVIINIGSEESVRVLSRKIEEEAKLPATKRIRVAYMGKILKESSSLQAQGWQQGHIINALVFNA